VREGLELGGGGIGQPQAGGRRPQPLDVRVELERAPAVDPQRLEDGASAQHAFVVGAKHRLAGRYDAAAELRKREQAQTAISGRAFTHDSSISSVGTESQTMPPPTQRWISPSVIANVRIVSARSRSPLP